MNSASYTPPILTVDAVIFRVINETLEVLLIKRANEPFKGQWALPGGYCPAGETTRDALERVLWNKTKIRLGDCKHVEQLYTADTIARDPRGHAISVIYMGLGTDLEPKLDASTQQPTFFPITDLPETAYDHDDIIRNALARLRSKLTYSNTAYSLLPPLFTLTNLQSVYEAVFGYELDKRNFRKKILSLGLIKETDKTFRDGAHRPARLYEFHTTKIETFDRTFLHPKS